MTAVGKAMRFIPEEVSNRLEAEWRQITNQNGLTKSASDRQLRPIDHIRKMAAMAIAHNHRKRL
jgi:hypothetical protein